jgi:GTP-binding protein
VIPVSAVQNRGFGELKARVATELKSMGFGYAPDATYEGMLKLSIIGRPNVGKSSLVNAIS